MRKAVLSGAALISIAVACSDERAITTEPIGAVGYGQNLTRIASNLPRGRVNFTTSYTALANAAADTIVITVSGLDSLTTGSYVWWAANDSATKFARLTGDLRMTGVDTTISESGDPEFTPFTKELGTVSEWTNGGPNRTFRFSVLRSQMAGLAATDSAAVILMSIESGTPGAEPGPVRPLWARRSERSTSTTNTNIAGLKFGNFKARRIEQYVYSSSAGTLPPATLTGTSDTVYRNVPRGRIEVRGDVFTVNDSNYFRPPVGYYYKAWGIKVGEFGVFVDTVSLGDKASPFPRRTSFKDADVSVPDPEYMYVSETPCPIGAAECPTQQPVIVASQHRALASALGIVSDDPTKPWKNFAWVYLTLQNKAAPDDRMGGVVIMNSNLPGSISGL